MRSGWKERRVTAAVAPILLALASCAGLGATAKPSTEQQPTPKNFVQQAVQQLLANQAAGRVRTISGVGYVMAPIAVFLANGEISLLPSTPDLESELALLHRRWEAGRRQPLPFEAFQAAFTRLTAQREAVGQAGGETLVRFAETDKKGRFRFEAVPEGRWILVADMSSPVSTLLWAVPIQVGPNDPPPLPLIDSTLLLEARKTERDFPTR